MLIYFLNYLFVQSSKREPHPRPKCRHVCNIFNNFRAPFICCWACQSLGGSTVPTSYSHPPFQQKNIEFPIIEADQGKDNDRIGSLNIWLSSLSLEPPSHMYCFRQPASHLGKQSQTGDRSVHVNFWSSQSITSSPSRSLTVATIPHVKGWPSLWIMLEFEASPFDFLHHPHFGSYPLTLDDNNNKD